MGVLRPQLHRAGDLLVAVAARRVDEMQDLALRIAEEELGDVDVPPFGVVDLGMDARDLGVKRLDRDVERVIGVERLEARLLGRLAAFLGEHVAAVPGQPLPDAVVNRSVDDRRLVRPDGRRILRPLGRCRACEKRNCNEYRSHKPLLIRPDHG